MSKYFSGKKNSLRQVRRTLIWNTPSTPIYSQISLFAKRRRARGVSLKRQVQLLTLSSSTSSKSTDEQSKESFIIIDYPSGVEAPRLQWALFEHCGTAFFPCPLPVLNFTTRGGPWCWREWARSRKPDLQYIRRMNKAIVHTMLVGLKSANYNIKSLSRLAFKGRLTHTLEANQNYTLMKVHNVPKFKDVILSEQLFRTRFMDSVTLKTFIRELIDFFERNLGVSLASMDNAGFTERQATDILVGLGNGSADTLEILSLWHFCTFVYGNECHPFIDALCQFKNLTVLAVDYGVLGQKSGLRAISSIIEGSFRRFTLQLVCEDVVEGTVSCGEWRDVCLKCPGLVVELLITIKPIYDDLKWILTENMPLQQLCLFYSIHILEAIAWELESTFRLLHTNYQFTLQRLYLQISGSPEDIHLSSFFKSKRTRKTYLAVLKVLEATGNFDLEELERMIKILIACPVKPMLQVLYFRVKAPMYTAWNLYKNEVDDLRIQYEAPLRERGIDFCLETIKM